MRPPGLEIVDVASTASRDTLITGGKRRPPNLESGLVTILPSCAGTQCSVLSTTSAMAPQTDHDFPHDTSCDQRALPSDGRHVLILSELHRVLAWVDKKTHTIQRPGAVFPLS